MENQDKTVKSDLSMIVNEATRCKNIVRGLLDFSRQSRVSKTPTDLTVLISEVNNIMEQKAKSSNVRISYEVASDIPVIMVDEGQVKQMLVNLIQNGIDAIHGGGEVKVTSRLSEGEDSVKILVSDNGCGIPKAELPNMFQEFFRASNAVRRKIKGTGLGLSIVREIIELHAGRVSVSSDEDRGATFTVRLPRAP